VRHPSHSLLTIVAFAPPGRAPRQGVGVR